MNPNDLPSDILKAITRYGVAAGKSYDVAPRDDLESVIAAEIGRLQQWINDCQAGMYINCVYCGHRYGPDSEVPASMADVLKEHVEKCPYHPMSALKAYNERLRSLLREALDWIKSERRSTDPIQRIEEALQTKEGDSDFTAGVPQPGDDPEKVG